MNKIVILLIFLSTLFVGCSSSSVFKSYPTQVNPYLVSVSSGQKIDFDKVFEKQIDSNDGVLYAMEKARMQQIQNFSTNSINSYRIAISRINYIDDKAVISASDTGAQASALALNDNAIPYNPPGYERVLLRHLQSMNYLADGDLEGASVEVRAANNEQKKAKKAHEKDVEKAKSSVDEAKKEADLSNFNSAYAEMNTAVGNVKSSFLNAYTFYYSGIVYELANSPNDAYIDYKRALEIAPNNVYIIKDVLRLAKKLDMREDYRDFKKLYSNFEDSDDNSDMGVLVVLFEDSFVKQRESIDIPIPYFGADTIVPITCPIYQGPWHTPQQLVLMFDGKSLKSSSICSVTDLAVKSLQENLPAILARVVLRGLAKATAAKQMSDSMGGWGSLAATIYNIVTESADKRSWLSLPDNAQVIRTYMTQGEHELKLEIGYETKNYKVVIEKQKITIVRVIKTNGLMYVSTLY
ncbi:MAG: hypothetical protein PF692_11680 [Kiritimatiellae bacterium]|nr:hypothetical protein [Kiritimatiellia bacterium]